MLVTDLITLIRDIGNVIENRSNGLISNSGFNDASERGRRIGKTMDSKNYKSIKEQNKNTIASYPILVSDNISTESAYILSNAFEHEYAYLISLLINNQIAYSGVGNAGDIVTRFHQNIARYESYDSDKISLNQKFNMNNINYSTFPKSFNETSSTHTTQIRNGDTTTTDEIKRSLDEPLGITDRDIKKYNDLTPMILQINTNVNNTNTKTIINKQIAIGVKTIIHKLPSSEICLNLSQAVKGSSTLFRLIRWTTGELKLFRDLILCVDENKKFAKDSIRSDNFWWKKLDDIYRLNKLYKWINVFSGKQNAIQGPIPTATLVISINDVNNIKSMFGIDLLKNTAYTRKMFDRLSLLSFAIVDESIETMYLYDENNRSFSPYPFKSIRTKKASDGVMNIEDLKPLFKR